MVGNDWRGLALCKTSGCHSTRSQAGADNPAQSKADAIFNTTPIRYATLDGEMDSNPYTNMDRQPQPTQQPTHAQVLAHQDQVIRQQDQSLDQLARSVATLHNLGGEIHGELRSKRPKFFVDERVHPQTLAVVQTRAAGFVS